MNAQHTPGPWIVDATPSHCPCVFMVRAKANKCDAWVPVADCSGHLDSAANARLIAAAPDLLAACQAIAACASTSGPHGTTAYSLAARQQQESTQDMKTNIKTIAEKAGLELTRKGNLELGSDDQGSHGTPGSRASNSAVSYYLTPSGDVRAVIDNRSGRNQGYIEWQDGDVTRMDGADLDEAIRLAKEHVESLDDADLMRAWRIASSEARATMRKIEAADTTEDTRSPLADVSTAELEAELARRRMQMLRAAIAKASQP